MNNPEQIDRSFDKMSQPESNEFIGVGHQCKSSTCRPHDRNKRQSKQTHFRLKNSNSMKRPHWKWTSGAFVDVKPTLFKKRKKNDRLTVRRPIQSKWIIKNRWPSAVLLCYCFRYQKYRPSNVSCSVPTLRTSESKSPQCGLNPSNRMTSWWKSTVHFGREMTCNRDNIETLPWKMAPRHRFLNQLIMSASLLFFPPFFQCFSCTSFQPLIY